MKTYFIVNGKFTKQCFWEVVKDRFIPVTQPAEVICYDADSYKYFKKNKVPAKWINTIPLKSGKLEDFSKICKKNENLQLVYYKGFDLWELTEYDRIMTYHWNHKKSVKNVYTEAVNLINVWYEFFEEHKKEDFRLCLFNPAPLFRRVPELMAKRYDKEVIYPNEYFGRLYFDTVGYTARSSLCYVWNDLKTKALSFLDKTRLDNFLDSLHERKPSRGTDISQQYKQPIDYASKEELFHKLNIPSHRKMILQLEQFPYDANKIIHNPLIKTKAEYILPVVETLKHHPDYFLVVKRHPEDTVSKDEDFKMLFGDNKDCRLVDNINIHTLIQNSWIVITLNSTAGLEALTYYKPVITIAQSIYANKGFTYDVRALEEYPAVLNRVLNNPTITTKQKRDIDKFLHYLIFETGT